MALPARLARYGALVDYLVDVLVQEFDAAQAPRVDVDPPSAVSDRARQRVDDDATSEDRP
jgi:hypothetical protein